MRKFFVFFLCCVLAVSLSACGSKPIAQETGQPYNGSIEDLINQGKSVKCILEADADSGILSGTTYVSGKNARSDFEQTDADNKISGHFITDDTWMYSWNDNFKDQAFKFRIEDMQKEEFKGQADEQGAGNYQDKMNYQCYSWRADQSFFNPPSDINFQDMSELLKQFNVMGDNAANNVPTFNNVDNSVLCGQCNQITDEQRKEMCKKQLGCK